MSKKDFSVALKYVEARPRSQRRKGTEARVSGISVVGSGASATDLSLLQANLISVTNNFTALKDLFDSMFEVVDGNIHAKLSLWSSGGITAGGVGSGGSGGGGASYDRLDAWSDYSADKAGYVLSALLGKDLDNRVSALANAGYITASALAPYALRSEIPSLDGYATQSWVGENFLSKSGGKLVYSGAQGLEAERTDGAPTHIMFFGLVNGTSRQLGGFGMNGYNDPVYVNPNGIRHKVLTAENYSDYALSVYGGTVNSPSLASLVINRNNSTGASVITFTRNSDFTHFLGFNDNSGPKWLNADYQVYPLLHSGNYADYITNSYIKSTLGISDWALASVKPTYTASEVGALGVNDTAANASKLDGVEISNMFKYYGFNTDLSIFNEGNYQTTTHYINSTDSTITNAPESYGTAVNFGARVGNFQLFASNTHRLYFRQRWTSNWRNWKTIAFASDIPTKLSQLTDDVVAGNYLSKSGGTITGALTSSSIIKASSFFSTSISIECGANGVVDPITYGGEINRFSSNLYLQNRGGNIYLSHASGTTYIRGKLNGVGATFTDTLTVPSITIGGATITYDSVNEALCINGNMYALGGITAGGAGISTYSSLEARVARLEQQLNIS